MNTINYLPSENKALLFLTLLGCSFLYSCTNKEEENKSEVFLGSPRNAQLSAKFIPKNWIQKQLAVTGDTSKTESENFSFLSSISPNTPSVNKLIENLIKLEPDLSKNWILNAGIEDNIKFASIYFKINNAKAIEELLDAKKIYLKVQQKNITLLLVDNKAKEHNFIIYDKEHLLLIKTYGNEKESMKLAQNCTYSTKDDYITQFEAEFKNKKNDLDIRIKNDSKISEYIQLPILKDLTAGFDGFLSLNVKENSLDLSLNPLNTIPLLDSVFLKFSPIQEKKASVQANIELKNLISILSKYEYLDDVEYELNKGKLNFKTLRTICNGLVQVAYTGKINTPEKTITYVFDENFNQVEKVVMKNQETFDFVGIVGTPNGKSTFNYLLKNSYISKTKKNTYEPIIGSKSVISVKNKQIDIGKPLVTQKYAEQLTFLLSVSDPKSLPIPKEAMQVVDLLSCTSGSLIMNKNKEINLTLTFGGASYAYLKNAWSFVQPKI